MREARCVWPAGGCRAGWYSLRVRASAERGRVQGPGRAEADFGPRTVTAALFAEAIPSGHRDDGAGIPRTPDLPRMVPPTGPLIPPLMGPPTPPLMGPPGVGDPWLPASARLR
jgi:hypothetical protein